jgi:ADP-ribose pyrophosphatase
VPSEILKSETLFSGHFKLRQDTISLADGTVKKRDIIEYPDAVVVVAVDGDGQLILERQYRYAAGLELIELPAGGIDPDETPEAAACREMQEETGYFPRCVRRLTSYYSSPGYSTELLHLFLATDLVEDRLTAEDSDEITLLRVSPAEALLMIKKGKIIDSKSIAGLMYYLMIVAPTP